MERARARIMRVRQDLRQQRPGRRPYPDNPDQRTPARTTPVRIACPAGHLNATSSSCWPRRDPQLLRNRRGRPVLACSQRSSHPRRAGSWKPGPPPAGAATSTLEGGAGQDTRRANGQDERPAPARARAATRWPQICPAGRGLAVQFVQKVQAVSLYSRNSFPRRLFPGCTCTQDQRNTHQSRRKCAYFGA